MKDAYILDALRTPIGKKGGHFKDVHPCDLAAELLAALVARNRLDPAAIDDVVMGCVTQTGEQGLNIARNSALTVGFPVTVTGTSVNRLCGSSQQACNFAAMAVASGQADLVIGAGVESMTRVAMGSDAGPVSQRIEERFEIVNQGISAELVAERWGLSRAAIDEFSLGSHAKAVRAASAGRFASQIHPVAANGVEVRADEGPRADTSLDKMARLKSAFKEGGVITAGNSSQISDGAAALLIGTPERARSLGLAPRARFVATAVAGVDPTIMLTGPIPATRKVLDRSGLGLDQIDLFEVNEAFAPVVMAWLHETGAPPDRVNVNGGAVALGHPLGASGARLLTTLLCELERREGRYGLATMCIGFGQGIATIIERVD